MKKIIILYSLFLTVIASFLFRYNLRECSSIKYEQIKLYCKMSGEVKINDLTTLTFVFEDKKESINATGFTFDLFTNIELKEVSFEKCSSNNIDDYFTLSKEEEIIANKYKYSISISIDYSLYSNIFFSSGDLISMTFSLPNDTLEDDLRIQFANTSITSRDSLIDDSLIYHEGENIALQIHKDESDEDSPYNFLLDGTGLYFKHDGIIESNLMNTLDVYFSNSIINKPTSVSFYLKSNYRLHDISYISYGNTSNYQFLIRGDSIEEITDESQPGFYFYNIEIFISEIDSHSMAYFDNGLLCSIDFVIKSDIENRVLISSFFEKAENSSGDIMESFNEDKSVIETTIIPPSNEIEISNVILDDKILSFNNKKSTYSPIDSSQTSLQLIIEMNKGKVENVKVNDEIISLMNNSYTICLGDYGSETKVTIYLIANDEKTKDEYEISIIRKKSNNSKLREIELNVPNDDFTPLLFDKDGNSQISFDKDIKEYCIGIISKVDKINVTLIAEDTFSRIYYKDNLYENEILIDDVSSSFQIKVVAQDDSYSIYSFSFKILSDDVSLSSIEVKGILDNGEEVSIGQLNKNGDKYDLSFENDTVKSFLVIAEPSSNKSFVTYSPNKYYFVQGLTETGRIIVNVTSESGVKKNYIVSVTKKSTIKEFDSSIIVKNAENGELIMPSTSSSLSDYYYVVSDEISRINVSVISNTSLSNIEGEGNYDLPINNPITVVLTNSNGDNLSINIHIGYSNSLDDNQISNILILSKEGGEEVTDVLGNPFVFDKEIINHTFTVPYEVNSIYFQVDKSSSMATVFGDGIKHINVGENRFVIYATSDSNKKGKEYSIKIIRNDTTEKPYLSSILINGSIIDDFSMDKINYQVIVDRNIEQIDIQCVLSSSNSSMNFTNGLQELVLGRNVFNITVTSILNEEREYTITILRAEHKNTINNITIYNDDIILSSYIYNKDIYNIELEIPYSISSLTFDVEYDGEHGSIKGNGKKYLIEGLNIFEVFVISETNVKGKVYTFNITRAFVNKNNYLSSLEITSNGKSLLSSFDKEIGKYAIIITENDSIINVNASLESSLSRVSGLGDYEINNIEEFLDKGIFNIEVKVTSESNEERIYIVTFYLEGVEVSDDNTISSVMIKSNNNVVLFYNEFEENKLSYSLTVPYSVLSITIECQSNGSIVGEGTYQLYVNSKKTIEIYAISDRGTKGNVYTFEIVRNEANENTNIKNLFINGENQNLTSNNTYSIEFDYSVNRVLIGIELENGSANVSVKQNGTRIEVNDLLNFSIDLAEGNNIINFTITADNDVTRVFSLTIKREYKLIDLSSLEVKGFSLLDKDKKEVIFNPKEYIYYIDVPFNVTSLEIETSINDSGFTVVIERNILNLGENIVLVKVVSNQNSDEFISYELHVNRKLKTSNEISIQDFYIEENDKFNNEFKDDISDYSFDVNSNISVLNISIDFNKNEDEEKPSIEVIGGDNLSFGENEVIVIITSSDGSFSKKYSLKVYRRNVTLSQAKIDEIEEFRFDFRNDVNEYTYQVPSKISTIHLSFDVDTKDTTYVLSNDRLKVGKNELTIDVYSKNVKVKSISLIIYRTDGNVATQITPIIVGSVLGGVGVISVITFIIVKNKKAYEKERNTRTKEKKGNEPLKK